MMRGGGSFPDCCGTREYYGLSGAEYPRNGPHFTCFNEIFRVNENLPKNRYIEVYDLIISY